MKAMILAAGFGTRVRPLTETLPKPMVPIINKPVMEFLVDLLRRHGFDQIIVSTAYLANEIESYFGDGSLFGVQIAYSFEGYHEGGEVRTAGLGSAGALRAVQDFSGFYDDTFVVLCGDAIIDLDLTRAVAIHRERKALATVLLQEVPREHVGRYGVVETDADDRILQFQEKPRPEEAISTVANTGIYVFDPQVFDHIPSGRWYDICCDLFPRLIEEGRPLYGLRLPFNWIDIGRTSDYWDAIQAILRGSVGGIEPPGRLLAPGVRAGICVDVRLDACQVEGPLYIGACTRIEPGATIVGPTVVGRNCVIEAGARIEACIVGPYTRVSGFANLKEKIVSGRFCVDRSGHNVDLARTGYAFVVDDARERRDWTEDQKILIDFLESARNEVPMAEGWGGGR